MSEGRGPLVDIVVAVHDLARPVARAVSSVLDGTEGQVRVTVACHELDVAEVAAQLPAYLADRMRLLEVRDGLRSPSGPYNAGLEAATAPYVGIVGSDDFLEPGAVAAWYRRAVRQDADVVLAPLRMQDGTAVRTPRVRPFRSRRLDLVRDRLAYRSAPLGLMRRAHLDRHGLRLTPAMRSGGDLAFTARLWTTGARVDLAARTPRYVIGTDAPTRVTTRRRAVADEVQAYGHLLAQPWLRSRPSHERRAIAVKTVRIHLLGAVRRRKTAADWTGEDAAVISRLTARWVETAPGVLKPFSRADRILLDVVLADPTPEALVRANAARDAAGRAAQILTPRVLDNLDRESTVRYRLADLAWRAR